MSEEKRSLCETCKHGLVVEYESNEIRSKCLLGNYFIDGGRTWEFFSPICGSVINCNRYDKVTIKTAFGY